MTVDICYNPRLVLPLNQRSGNRSQIPINSPTAVVSPQLGNVPLPQTASVFVQPLAKPGCAGGHRIRIQQPSNKPVNLVASEHHIAQQPHQPGSGRNQGAAACAPAGPGYPPLGQAGAVIPQRRRSPARRRQRRCFRSGNPHRPPGPPGPRRRWTESDSLLICCCSTIMTPTNWSAKMSSHEGIDIESTRTGQDPGTQQRAGKPPTHRPGCRDHGNK